MDSQATATVQTILNEPLERYKALYSEYMATIVEMHNYNTQFLKFEKVRDRDGYHLRRTFKKLRDIDKQLWRACIEAESKHWELFPRPVGAPKKNKNVDVPGSDNKRTTR